MQPQKNEKYEFLYKYARAAFDDELQRFRNLEDKASKFLSLFSLVIVGYTLLIESNAGEILNLNNFISWLVFISVCFTYLAFLTSWSFLFRAMKFIEMQRLPLDEKFLETYEPLDLTSIQYVLTKASSNCLSKARAGNKTKSDLLIKAYKDIGISMWALSISIILMVIEKFI
ncbi:MULTISPECIES: hypothetical protein [unclassified Methylophaga]|jgi:hypothetical protein|uniref:hypothetical protein n=1 Tax=unclassified Methylophaga TaxID=2629249 RepID=UPI000ECFD75D|nr:MULTISPECIES: hypothetical protein [unclassified Methylophaga]HCC81457.1 hypothetical protein [Methylophaga sp.]|tara:strand:+ start:187 stop:702 length:516 start_codon:yes stop_codon:yes gene_type:complete